MNGFDIQSNWMRPSATLPNTGTRCIVTDGDVTVFATYVNADCGWLISELTFDDAKKFDIQGWMYPPKPIKKMANHEKLSEINSAKPK